MLCPYRLEWREGLWYAISMFDESVIYSHIVQAKVRRYAAQLGFIPVEAE